VSVVKRVEFLNDLEYTLKQGLLARENETAIEACGLMMLGSRDLVRCAVDAVLDTRRKDVASKVLSACIGKRRVSLEQKAVDVIYRVVGLRRFSLKAEEYRLFIAILVTHLSAEDAGVRSLCLSWLRQVQPYIRDAFGGAEGQPPFPGDLAGSGPDAAACKGIQREWEQWLKSASEERINLGVSRWLKRAKGADKGPTVQGGEGPREAGTP
jgi:hypothetical protein